MFIINFKMSLSKYINILLIPLLTFLLFLEVNALARIKKDALRVRCSRDQMVINFNMKNFNGNVYLRGLKHYNECLPISWNERQSWEFKLDLKKFEACTITRIVNEDNGEIIYYHHVVLEDKIHREKTSVLAMCSPELNKLENETSNIHQPRNGSLKKRSAQFPLDFEEPDYEVEITREITETAPVPEITIEVRQSDVLVDDELFVKPGTPLSMTIELDDRSSDIYGLQVSHMDVTDTRSQQETLISNSCTRDTYLFDNFLTTNGDRLKATFKAFKFPQSNYVLFKGTVDVCLQKCNGVQCPNGEIGFGRKKRSIKSGSIYKVTTSTILQVGNTNSLENKDEKGYTAYVSDFYRFYPELKTVEHLSEEFGLRSKYAYFNGGTNNNHFYTKIYMAITFLITLIGFQRL